MGLVNRVVPLEKLEEETMALADKLAKGAPAASRMAKLLMYNSLQMDFSAALDTCSFSEMLTLLTDDYAEGEKAMMEKRVPKFVGR